MDELDVKIIKALQENARLKASELARILKRPRSTILQRMEKLKDEGVILGYSAVVNPWKLGYNYLAYIMLRIRRGIYARLDQVQIAKKILEDTSTRKDLPYVEEASIVTGTYDIMLKVWIHDWAELSKFLLNYLSKIEEVASTETFMVLQKLPEKPKPIPPRGDIIEHGK